MYVFCFFQYGVAVICTTVKAETDAEKLLENF